MIPPCLTPAFRAIKLEIFVPNLTQAIDVWSNHLSTILGMFIGNYSEMLLRAGDSGEPDGGAKFPASDRDAGEESENLLAKPSVEDEITEEVDRVVELLENLRDLAADDNRRIDRLRQNEIFEHRDEVHRADWCNKHDEVDGDDEKCNGRLSTGSADGASLSGRRLCHGARTICDTFSYAIPSVCRPHLALFAPPDNVESIDDETVEYDEKEGWPVDVDKAGRDADAEKIVRFCTDDRVYDAEAVDNTIQNNRPPDVVGE